MSLDNQIVYDLVDDVPSGQVAGYGMIAIFLPGVTARMVGRALCALPAGSETPWHRIVNAAGRPHTEEAIKRLKKEGVLFRPTGMVDWKACRWKGPSPDWIDKVGADTVTVMEIVAGWRS